MPNEEKDEYQYVIHIVKVSPKTRKVEKAINSLGFLTLTDLCHFVMAGERDKKRPKSIAYIFQTRQEAIEARTEPTLTCLGPAPAPRKKGAA